MKVYRIGCAVLVLVTFMHAVPFAFCYQKRVPQYQDRRFCSYKDVVRDCLLVLNTDIQHDGAVHEATHPKG